MFVLRQSNREQRDRTEVMLLFFFTPEFPVTPVTLNTPNTDTKQQNYRTMKVDPESFKAR